MLRVLAAAAAQFQAGGHHLLLAELLGDVVLNRHAVVIPPRHVGSLVALHRPVADDQVLQDLVEGMAHVDIAVRVGRTVVQDEAPVRGHLFQREAIEVHLLPPPLDLRL